MRLDIRYKNRKMKIIRYILSALMVILIAVMAAGTVIEKYHGSGFAISHVYGTWWFALLWALAAAGMVTLLVVQKSWKRPAVFTLHIAILLILLGALLTKLTGQHGQMTLKPGTPVSEFTIEKEGDSQTVILPFALTLDHFEMETYPGTRSPMDFVSYLRITDGGTQTDAKISMNHILKHRHYRFYQSNYDQEGNSVLSVSHDPWGIGVTYAGYLLLPVAICNGKEINREIPGEIVVEKRGSRNRLYLYFEIDNDFFFFQVENNSIYGYSNDTKFTDPIVQTKVKKRMLPPSNGLPACTYKLGNRSQKNKFMKKFYRAPAEEEDNNEE